MKKRAVLVGAVLLLVFAVVLVRGRTYRGAERDGTRNPNPPTAGMATTAQPPRVGRSAPAIHAPPRTRDDRSGRAPVITLRETDPTDTPDRAARRASWIGWMNAFRRGAALSEAQWQRFLDDLHDLAVEQQRLVDANVDPEANAPAEEWKAQSDDLGAELERRMSEYMDERQLNEFRFRLHADALVSSARAIDLTSDAARPDLRMRGKTGPWDESFVQP